MSKTHLSISQLKTFTACPLKWYYGYIERLKKKTEYKSQALLMGTWWDTFTNMKYTGENEADIEVMTLCAENMKLENLAKCYALANIADKYISWENMPQNVQVELESPLESVRFDKLYGIADGVSPDGTVGYERKLTSRAENYLTIENVELQIGSYLYISGAKEWVMQVTQTPALKLGKSESISEYQARCEAEIESNLSKYFAGYNYMSQTYGKTYFRSDFDFGKIMGEIQIIAKVIDFMEKNSLYYANTEGCDRWSGCDYFNICRLGISEYDKFDVKEVEYD